MESLELLEKTQEHLRNLVSEHLERGIEQLLAIINDESPLNSDVHQNRGKYNEVEQNIQEGIIKYETKILFTSRIRSSLLDVIDNLELKDLSVENELFTEEEKLLIQKSTKEYKSTIADQPTTEIPVVNESTSDSQQIEDVPIVKKPTSTNQPATEIPVVKETTVTSQPTTDIPVINKPTTTNQPTTEISIENHSKPENFTLTKRIGFAFTILMLLIGGYYIIPYLTKNNEPQIAKELKYEVRDGVTTGINPRKLVYTISDLELFRAKQPKLIAYYPLINRKISELIIKKSKDNKLITNLYNQLNKNLNALHEYKKKLIPLEASKNKISKNEVHKLMLNQFIEFKLKLSGDSIGELPFKLQKLKQFSSKLNIN